MKLSKILSEARARPGTRKGVTHYHAEFGGDGTDIEWSKWDAQSVRSYEGAIRDAQDEFKVVGSEYAPGVWIGSHIGDVTFTDDADEDGPWRSANITGEACIVVQGTLPEGHPIFRKVQKDVEHMVSDEIEDAAYEDRDRSELRNNPDRYYGVSNRDFL